MPGAAYTMQTPFLWPLLTRLYPSAMFTAVCSIREITGRMPAVAAASMRALLGKQKVTSTPSYFRMLAMAVLPCIRLFSYD